mgnify:CR=1 FL=1
MSLPISPEAIAMPADIKRANRQKIIRELRTGTPVTAADIHEKTGISRPTVMRALQEYCDRGVVKSLGLGNTTSVGGKKPELFQFADARKLLCVNLWPQKMTLALCGLIGDVYAVESVDQALDGDLSAALERLRSASYRYLQKHNTALSDLYGVLLTVPGTVDYDDKMLRYNSQSPGWGKNVALQDALRPIFGDTTVYFVDNAGKAAGRAVLLEHPEYASRRLLTLFTTWGVSACMIERSHVLNGRDSLIGEIGHMLISDDGPVLCGCGKRGCLESLISIDHVRQMLAKAGHADLGLPKPITFPQLFDFSRQGNVIARSTVEYLAHCFAVVLHNLSLAYNQEVVVFQGDFAWADQAFDERLKAELREFRYYPAECFSIVYDQRDLSMLALQGGVEQLKRRYFTSLD